MILTKHAEIRIQQRCIPKLALELLIRYGNVEYQPGGTELVHFKEKGYARARKDLERTLRELDKLRDAYLVTQHAEAGEIIITAGYLEFAQ